LPQYCIEAGKFTLTGLKSSRYELRMYSDPPIVFSVNIPECKTEVYDLGAIALIIALIVIA